MNEYLGVNCDCTFIQINMRSCAIQDNDDRIRIDMKKGL